MHCFVPSIFFFRRTTLSPSALASSAPPCHLWTEWSGVSGGGSKDPAAPPGPPSPSPPPTSASGACTAPRPSPSWWPSSSPPTPRSRWTSSCTTSTPWCSRTGSSQLASRKKMTYLPLYSSPRRFPQAGALPPQGRPPLPPLWLPLIQGGARRARPRGSRGEEAIAGRRRLVGVGRRRGAQEEEPTGQPLLQPEALALGRRQQAGMSFIICWLTVPSPP